MLKIFERIIKDNEYEKVKSGLHPLLLMIMVVMICAVISYIIPAGIYERTLDSGIGREIIEPSSFSYIERTPLSLLDLLMSFTLGLQNASYVIFFLFIVGGMFAIINGTGALNIAIANGIKALNGKELFIIPILMTLFGCGAAFCGNFEEFLVFVPLVLACCMTVGYDSLTAVGIIFIAAAAGYGGALTNAFTVGIAQQIAGLPLFSGMSVRIALFVCLESASIAYVMWYAHLIKKNPKLSGSYAYDTEFNKGKRINLDNVPKLSTRQTLVIIVFLCGIFFSVWGIINKGYYIDELAGIFLIVGILGGIIGGLKPKEICEFFEKGCRDMLLPCLMIGLANSAIVILQSSNVLDTILHSMAGMLDGIPSTIMPFGMFLLHEIFNIAVPSGSAQASITMPLMATMADNAGITRQTAVLAFQLGDAFTNVLAPTGGEILAALAICKVPFSKWVKYLLPIFIIWVVISLVFLIYATQTMYGPF